MLKRLTIQNYALIDTLDIEFPDGLIIITGETGAGKSILLGAISLLLGNKAEASVFNDPNKNCVVEGEFDDDTILRRVISPAGRSRSFLNDEPVTLAQLSEISNKIIDIHSQHQHLLLNDPDFQLSVLDYFAGCVEDFKKYKEIYEEHKAKSDALLRLEEQIRRVEGDADYRMYQLQQLQDAKLIPGEMEELELEHSQLANAESIKGNLQGVVSLLNPFDTTISQNIKEAAGLLSKISSYIPGTEDLASRLNSVRIELEDIEQDVLKEDERVVVSPERLSEVEERISLLYSLMKKHGCATMDELIAVRDSYQNDLAGNEELYHQKELLTSEIASLDAERVRWGEVLTEKRTKAAPSLSVRIEECVRSLEMPRAVFRADISPKGTLTSRGGDSISFLFSANGDSRLSDISKVASGGELSRVMLALKSVMAEYASLPTMIFDEIDTGVSGRIADKMGDMIGRMGESMQIFAITHLPQIASKRGEHYLVSKVFEDGKARTTVKLLSEEERVMELARMLSGSNLTDAAIQNAKELLKNNL